jgi:uncharacterized membrane protein (DUF4010 family)
VVVQSALLGADGLSGEGGLSLTTSTSLLLAYGVGVLVGSGRVLEGVIVALLSSLLLVLRRELHEFARQLSKAEVRSAAEFAILAFVVYPLLPEGAFGPWDAIRPRTVWLLVVAMGGVGFVNYVVVRRYGGLGFAITGFFGGLVNSTAVIGAFADRGDRHAEVLSLAVGAVLLADAAMAVRNLLIVALFVPAAIPAVGLPLASVALVGLAASVLWVDWDADLDPEFDSPFSLASVLKFGALFLVVLVVSAGAQHAFGTAGFLATSLLSGLLSSGSTTTTAVTLYAGGQISAPVAAAGVLAGTAASILVKVALIAGVSRPMVGPVAKASGGLVAAGCTGLLALTLLP